MEFCCRSPQHTATHTHTEVVTFADEDPVSRAGNLAIRGGHRRLRGRPSSSFNLGQIQNIVARVSELTGPGLRREFRRRIFAGVGRSD